MKNLTTIFLTVVLITTINAQYPNGVHPEHKRTNVWFFGIDSLPQTAVCLDFNSGQTVSSIEPLYSTTVYAASTISDTAGNFMFYSTGDMLQNSGFQYMNGFMGHRWAPYGSLFIPVPENDSLLILFHSSCWNNNFSGGLRYTIINALANNGLGTIVQQDIPLLTGAAGSVVAAYHDNGTDFWIVSADTSGFIYSWLVDSSLTPQLTDTMQITTVLSVFGTPIGAIIPTFTTKPNAELLTVISVDLENGESTDYTVSLVHFDNISGEFKNELLIESHAGEVITGDYYPLCHSFSPQGDWVYIPFLENCLPRNGYIKRYTNLYNAVNPGDIYSEVVYTTTTHAAPYTIFHSPLGTMLFYTLLGDPLPTTGNTPYISTILYPDSTAPVVLHNNINTGALITVSPINNLPAQWYYRPQGYYTSKEKINNEALFVAPNPANDRLYILNGFTNIKEINFYGITGQKYKADNFNNYEIDVSNFVNGIYIMKITFNNGMSKTRKIIIQH